MQGTTVTLDEWQRVAAFQMGGGTPRNPLAYKTVNIYSLSLSTWHHMRQRLDSYVFSGRVNDYYEAVFRDMTADGAFNPVAVPFDHGNWYEIDTVEDLCAAQKLFANSPLGEARNTKIAAEALHFTKFDQAQNNNAPLVPQPRFVISSRTSSRV
jgi:NDP-sugar pyrophosphorylase family protein